MKRDAVRQRADSRNGSGGAGQRQIPMQPTSFPASEHRRGSAYWRIGLAATLAALFFLPSPMAAARDRSPIPTGTYTVKEGDSAWSVADRSGLSLEALIGANGLDGPDYVVVVGQKLSIPSGRKPGGTSLAPSATRTAASGGNHVVQKGESAWTISRAHGIPVQALIDANGLEPPYTIRIGQVLDVPGSRSPAQGQAAPAPAQTSGQGLGIRTCPVAGPRSFGDDFLAPRDGGRRQHQGIDIFAKPGTPVVSPVSGVVGRAGDDSGKGGLRVWVNGDDGASYYSAHLATVVVSPGQRVGAGSTLGSVGNTGNAAGSASHLHFEAHRGQVVNPYKSVKAVCR